MDEQQQKRLNALISEAVKKYGDVVVDHTKRVKCDVISTGSLAVDIATGIGGIPRGRISEVYGQESCLDRDTFVSYAVIRKSGKSINMKGGPISRLYERFHGINKHWLQTDHEAVFTAPCVNEEGRIFHNLIVDVVKTGLRECLEVKTCSGFRIIATPEHKFYTKDGFKELGDISVGEEVYVHNNTPFTKTHKITKRTEAVCVKHHPHGHDKIIEGKYPYKRIEYTRMVYEAYLNNLPLEDYRYRLNSGDLEGLQFLPKGIHIHHKNEDPMDNRIDNLEVIDPSSHGKIHATERHNNLRFKIVLDTIESIAPVGIRETYDIKMLSPHNNYIANKFCVHNSGKTTLMLQSIASAQKAGLAAYIDAEHALDSGYAKNLGVDMSDLVVAQPETAEQTLALTKDFLDSGLFSAIVIDSVAAMIPKAVLNGEMEDQHMGVMARLMSKAIPQLLKPAASANTAVVFINQMRSTMGSTPYAPQTTTTGGNSLKFYSSLRLQTSKSTKLKDGDLIQGNEVKVSVVKNKMAPPFTEAASEIIFGEGYNLNREILNFGVSLDLIEKSGAWYTIAGERCQGARSVFEFLDTNPDVVSDLLSKIRTAYNIA